MSLMEVIGKEFYHIHTIRDKSNCLNKHSEKWIKGNILNFGDKLNTNLLHDRIFNPHINIHWEKNLIKDLSQRCSAASSLKSRKEIQAVFYSKGLIFKYFQLTREIIFEEVRQSLFPDKPSRLNGVWLIEKTNIKLWLNLIPRKDFPQKIFLIKFTGKMNKADARWLTKPTFSFYEIYNNAIGYWNCNQQSKQGQPHQEYISHGSLEIIKQVTF